IHHPKMSLVETLQSQFEAALLHVAAIVSRFESEMLHIPPALRFFTVGAEPDHLFRQAFLFLLAPLHAFVTLPLTDLVCYNSRKLRRHGLVQCGEWYLWFFVTFWV
ncbi:uncharacterized protein K460DRAFT_262768, partial [Cucurbitaria berberidis CBS 394.84]